MKSFGVDASVLLLGVLLACGGDGTSPPVATTVIVSPTAVTFSSINDSRQLAAAVLDQRGDTISGQAITWSTSNGSVATVTGSGFVRAAGNGTAEIKAHAAGLSSGPSTVTVAQVATRIVLLSGNGQFAEPGAALAAPLVVRVDDQLGSPVAGQTVEFVVIAGGGSATPGTAQTGLDGRAQTVWTLGSSLGPQSLEVRSGTLTGSPIAFGATASNLQLTSVQPDTLIEGQSATLTGDGFSTTASENTVLIGGAAAIVTAASATTLSVTVPAYDCQPPRNVGVQLTIASIASNTITRPLKPVGGQSVALAVGQQQILLDPADFCLRFDASGAGEAYLVGVQSLSETPGNLQTTRLMSVTGFASASPPRPIPALQASAAGQLIQPSAREERWVRHRIAERDVRRTDSLFLSRRAIAALVTPSPTAAQAIIPATVNVGDTVKNVRVSRLTGLCADYDSIAVVVRAKGSRSIWVEDVNDPPNGYTIADVDSLSRYLDNVIFDTDTSYFGDPGDLDGNARVVIVITKEVNKRAGLLGFVISADFFSRASCATSNEGEFYYAKAPDPTALFGSTYSRDEAFADAPPLIAHEFTHIIQFAQRLAIGGAFTRWLFEGQATFAEEVNGFAVTGRSPGQNYGFAVAFNSPPSTPVNWHRGGFSDLAVYYGFESSTTRKAEAPHQCTWIGSQSDGNNGPCIPGREVYGVPWSLYRWAADQFGPGFPGGERGLHKALVANPLGGYANLATTVGVSIDTLLAQWAAMLYVDDRVPGAAGRLTMPSWNLVNVESGLVVPARLQPTEVAFGGFDITRQIRAGSSAYLRISGAGRPATTLRVRSSTGATLPGTMNLWIVRLQ